MCQDCEVLLDLHGALSSLKGSFTVLVSDLLVRTLHAVCVEAVEIQPKNALLK